jgi:hypothetical protein
MKKLINLIQQRRQRNKQLKELLYRMSNRNA